MPRNQRGATKPPSSPRRPRARAVARVRGGRPALGRPDCLAPRTRAARRGAGRGGGRGARAGLARRLRAAQLLGVQRLRRFTAERLAVRLVGRLVRTQLPATLASRARLCHARAAAHTRGTRSRSVPTGCPALAVVGSLLLMLTTSARRHVCHSNRSDVHSFRVRQIGCVALDVDSRAAAPPHTCAPSESAECEALEQKAAASGHLELLVFCMPDYLAGLYARATCGYITPLPAPHTSAPS